MDSETNKINCKRYYEQNKERFKENSKRYREAHKKEISNWHKQDWKNNREKYLTHKKQYYQQNLEVNRQKRREYYYKNKEKCAKYMIDYNRALRRKIRSIILWYFGYHCNQCGYTGDPRVLQLDHINGGGCKEQKTIGPISAYYYKRPAELFQKFQLLCANCNYLKRSTHNEF